MKSHLSRFLRVIASALLLAMSISLAWGFSGTFTVTETWSATLTYSHWGDQDYTGTKKFSGTQTGTIAVSGNNFTMLDKTGIPHSPPDGTSRSRTIFGGSNGFSINGDKVMPYILAGANLNGIFYLSAFMVRVPIVDGEIPVFNNYTAYGTSGTTLSSMSGSGSMLGSSLTISASSTSTWTPALGPPILIAAPASRIVTAGTDASFGMSAIGNPAPTYQWQRLPSGSSTWTNLSNGGNYSGVTTTTLAVSGTTETMNGDQFRCVATNSRGSITTSVATLTIGMAPAITVQPQDQTITASNEAAFAVSASGIPAPSLQWQRRPAGSNTWSNPSNGAVYSGVTTATLTVSGTVTSMNSDQFRCVASNSFGSVTSQVATLAVTAPVSAPLIESVIYAAGVINLRWHALAGRTYQVQFKGDLNQVSWSILGQFPATASTVTALDSSAAASSRRFYRIVLMP